MGGCGCMRVGACRVGAGLGCIGGGAGVVGFMQDGYDNCFWNIV